MGNDQYVHKLRCDGIPIFSVNPSGLVLNHDVPCLLPTIQTVTASDFSSLRHSFFSTSPFSARKLSNVFPLFLLRLLSPTSANSSVRRRKKNRYDLAAAPPFTYPSSLSFFPSHFHTEFNVFPRERRRFFKTNSPLNLRWQIRIYGISARIVTARLMMMLGRMEN